MENLTLDQIITAVEGKLIKRGSVSNFNKISTDTRKIEKDSVFIALKGENFNGNDFALAAAQKGASLCIIDELKLQDTDRYENLSVILVENTGKALLDLAEFYRSTLKNLKVIGVTGSTGKTSTKDITCAVLQGKFKVFKTSGNFNNEIGLPLMIFNLDSTYNVAVLEMGMSHFNEIHKMAKAARPDIALITNIGISHIENLKTRENILKAKLEITDFFKESNVLVVNGDNDMLKTVALKNYKLIKTSTNGAGEFEALNIKLSEDKCSFDIKEEDIVFEGFEIPVPGKHNVQNALLAVAAARELGLTYEEMLKGIEKLTVTSMRLDIVRKSKLTIVDDSYNASPDSMMAAIDVVMNIDGKRKVAILGTMRELGEKSYEAHKSVGKYAKEKGIEELITVGEFNDAYGEGYGNDKSHRKFSDVNELISILKSIINKDDVVLVKASRSMKFENVVKSLKEVND